VDAKRRTREHVLADRGAAHLELAVAECGFTLERIVRDYGIDFILFTFDDDGSADPGHVLVQLKATSNGRVLADGRHVAYPVKRADLTRWLREVMPVILELFDGRQNVAYWVYVQAHFGRLSGFSLADTGRTVTIRFPVANQIDPASIRRFRDFRGAVCDLVQGVDVHHE
jgi:hypothetical protein